MISPKSARRMLLCTTGFYLTLVITLTHMPLDYVLTEDLQQQGRIYWMDKCIHVLMYTGLTTLFFLCMNPVEYDERTGDLVILPGQIIVLSVNVMLFAVLDEVTQPLVGRSCELLDLAADFAAIFPGASLFLTIQLIRQSVRHSV